MNNLHDVIIFTLLPFLIVIGGYWILNFLWYIIKIPVENDLIIKKSIWAKEIEEQIVKILIQTNNLKIEEINNWKQSVIELVKKVWGQYSYENQVLNKIIQAPFLDKLSVRLLQSITLTNTKIERTITYDCEKQIEFEIEFLQWILKTRILMYTIPIKNDTK